MNRVKVHGHQLSYTGHGIRPDRLLLDKSGSVRAKLIRHTRWPQWQAELRTPLGSNFTMQSLLSWRLPLGLEA